MRQMQAAALIVAALVAVGPARADDATATMSVTGTGSVEAVPDRATVTLGVEEQGPTAEAATDAMAKSVRAILGRLEAAGIPERDIQTTGLTLYPVYSREVQSDAPQKVVGFSASSSLTVEVAGVENIGPLLDKVISAGANRLQGIAFDLSNREALLDQARREAVSDAFRKARLYAESAGVELGDVLEISESPSGGGPYPMARAEAMTLASVPVVAGETVVESTIQLKIAIH